MVDAGELVEPLLIIKEAELEAEVVLGAPSPEAVKDKRPPVWVTVGLGTG